MELVWRNETGSELGRKKYDPDEKDVCQVLAEAEWILGVGDTLTLEKDKIDDEVLECLKEKVNDVFLEFAQKYNIKTGDCDPWDCLRLDEKTEELAAQIVYILKMQMRESDVDEDGEPKDDKY